MSEIPDEARLRPERAGELIAEFNSWPELIAAEFDAYLHQTGVLPDEHHLVWDATERRPEVAGRKILPPDTRFYRLHMRPHEHEEIKRAAKARNMTMNAYIVEAAVAVASGAVKRDFMVDVHRRIEDFEGGRPSSLESRELHRFVPYGSNVWCGYGAENGEPCGAMYDADCHVRMRLHDERVDPSTAAFVRSPASVEEISPEEWIADVKNLMVDPDPANWPVALVREVVQPPTSFVPCCDDPKTVNYGSGPMCANCGTRL